MKYNIDADISDDLQVLFVVDLVYKDGRKLFKESIKRNLKKIIKENAESVKFNIFAVSGQKQGYEQCFTECQLSEEDKVNEAHAWIDQLDVDKVEKKSSPNKGPDHHLGISS